MSPITSIRAQNTFTAITRANGAKQIAMTANRIISRTYIPGEP
jgi:hypothetical protein